jgi:NADH-quinone oxidoreductase subunit G
MSDNKVNVTIDGVECQAEPGAMLIEVADEAGIYIPRFCYHNKLSISANCRMCLVEVEKAPKPLPACATPVMDGMNVSTNSDYAKKAQNNVMEFLLINHPLDCPICDQGGECELQDIAMGYGRDASAFKEDKRAVSDKDIGPLIGMEMTRCIHCTRCVRFGDEIAGLRELGMTGRGMYVEVGTYVENTVDHEMSGNIIDLCPVGALTAKPSRFGARAWEIRQTESIAPHDAVGSNVYVHAMRDKLVRVVPRDNEAINEVWLSDRDRFSYQGVMHEERIATPLIKKDGKWIIADWQTAIDTAIDGIKSVVNSKGADSLGAWVSPQATLEEMFLLQGIVRHLGSHNIDHRMMQTDFRSQGYESSIPTLGIAIEDIEKQNSILVVGSNIRKEQPIIAHRIRKAALSGAQVSAINPRDFDLRMDLLGNFSVHPAAMVAELAAVASLLDVKRGSVINVINASQPSEQHRAIADSLKSAEQGLILLGQIAVQHADYSMLSELAAAIADVTKVTFAVLPASGNTTGAWQAGIVPHRLPGGVASNTAGKNIAEMLETPPAALLIHNIEPEHDCADPQRALEAAKAAEFAVVMTPYVNDQIKDYANVILPIAPYTETDGTFVNMEGLAQSFNAAVKCYAESSPAWKVYRVMGEQLGLESYQYETAAEVLADVLQIGQGNAAATPLADALSPVLTSNGLLRSGEVSIYATDSLVRRAASLQDTADGMSRRVAVMNSSTAEKAGVNEASQVLVTQGDQVVGLELSIEEGMADNSIWVPLIPELGGLNAEVQVKAAS